MFNIWLLKSSAQIRVIIWVLCQCHQENIYTEWSDNNHHIKSVENSINDLFLLYVKVKQAAAQSCDCTEELQLLLH